MERATPSGRRSRVSTPSSNRKSRQRADSVESQSGSPSSVSSRRRASSAGDIDVEVKESRLVAAYGFAGWAISALSLIIFFVWAFVPEAWLLAVGFTYYPSKELAVTIPAWMLVSFSMFLLAYTGYNTMLIPSLSSRETFTDPDAKRLPARGAWADLHSSGTPEIADIDVTVLNRLWFEQDEEGVWEDAPPAGAHAAVDALAAAAQGQRWGVVGGGGSGHRLRTSSFAGLESVAGGREGTRSRRGESAGTASEIGVTSDSGALAVGTGADITPSPRRGTEDLRIRVGVTSGSPGTRTGATDLDDQVARMSQAGAGGKGENEADDGGPYGRRDVTEVDDNGDYDDDDDDESAAAAVSPKGADARSTGQEMHRSPPGAFPLPSPVGGGGEEEDSLLPALPPRMDFLRVTSADGLGAGVGGRGRRGGGRSRRSSSGLASDSLRTRAVTDTALELARDLHRLHHGDSALDLGSGDDGEDGDVDGDRADESPRSMQQGALHFAVLLSGRATGGSGGNSAFRRSRSGGFTGGSRASSGTTGMTSGYDEWAEASPRVGVRRLDEGGTSHSSHMQATTGTVRGLPPRIGANSWAGAGAGAEVRSVSDGRYGIGQGTRGTAALSTAARGDRPGIRVTSAAGGPASSSSPSPQPTPVGWVGTGGQGIGAGQVKRRGRRGRQRSVSLDEEDLSNSGSGGAVAAAGRSDTGNRDEGAAVEGGPADRGGDDAGT